ncbi:MAG: hypothetical protein ABWZ25_11565 [Chitinophagaceae bacterium]
MKFKLLATIIVFISLNTFLFSQNSTSRWQIELRPGIGIPLGDFGDKSILMDPQQIKLDGLAKAGFAANLAVSYALKQNIGITFIAGLNRNKQDEEAFKAGPGISAAPYEEKIETNNWNIGKIMAGAWLQTDLAQSLHLRFHLTAGVAQTSSPYYRYIQIINPGTAQSQVYSYWQDKIKLNPAFCYEAGLQLIHQVSKPIAISFGSSLFRSLMKDRKEYYISPAQYSRRKWDYQVSILTLDLGIHFSF